MIRNIIFDLGNVLLDFKPAAYLESKYGSCELANRLYKEVFCSSEWIELDRGTLTAGEAIELIALRHPDISEHVKSIMQDWDEILVPIEGTIKLLVDLKAQSSCKLYLLSNFHKEAFLRVSIKYDFFNSFDGMIVSSSIRLLKPDPAIFKHLLSEYGLIPGESLFIDDMKDNVEAARKLGMDSIQFINAEALREELKLRGIL